MNSNQKVPTLPSVSTTVDLTLPQPVPPAANDNGARSDTTPLVARPEVVHSIRAVLRRYRIAPQDMADAIAEVQVESIETARACEMPRGLAQWKALATTIAVHWALDRQRQAKPRRRYDAGLCEDPDAFIHPIFGREQRDPVDTKRYLAVLKELFDSGQMPEHGAEILQGEADGVSHDEIAGEIGVSRSVVRGRLFRMRARFRARLAALGMLALLLLLLLRALLSPAEVAAPAPPPQNEAPAAPDGGEVNTRDGGRRENRPAPSNQIAP